MKIFTAITVTVISIIVISPVLYATIINIPDDYSAIQEGIDASENGDTVLVQPGTYVENINFNGHNIVLGSMYLTTGDTSYISTTVIDGNSSGSVVTFENAEDTTAVIIGFTVRNGYWGIKCSSSSPVISHNNIIENSQNLISGFAVAGGIKCEWSNAKIANNLIAYNEASQSHDYGASCCYGIVSFQSNLSIVNNVIRNNFAMELWPTTCGIRCSYSNSTIINNLIFNNYASDVGPTIYGIGCDHSNDVIVNNIIVDNESIGGDFGAGFAAHYSCSSIVINTIIWNNDGSQIFVDDYASPVITYCDIEGGWEGEGNIDVDPLFRDPDNGDFHLMATYCGDPYNSPCIDAGHPDILDSLLDCDWGLGEPRSDMGAYGGGEGYVSIDYNDIVKPKEYFISQNYPNPFNASTTISYTLPYSSDVTLDIYDILGRKVETLYNGNQPAGSQSVIWNADGFSSGVYFYKLTAGEYKHTQKIMLLK